MNEDQILRCLISLGVTAAASYLLSLILDTKTAARVSPVVLIITQAALVPRILAATQASSRR